MRITAQLRRSRRPGTNDWVGEGTIFASEPDVAPARCYADADGAAAAAHGNPTEDPLRAFGDHPVGLYLVIAVRWSTTESERQKYGPVRLRLDPLAGDALKAKRNGRDGLCIHGGPLAADGRLRATNGCLRTDDETAIALAKAVERELHAERSVGYACEEIA